MKINAEDLWQGDTGKSKLSNDKTDGKGDGHMKHDPEVRWRGRMGKTQRHVDEYIKAPGP